MSKIGLLKALGGLLWLACVGALGAAIANQDRFFVVENKPIALVESANGTILGRAEGLVRWSELSLKDGVSDGDRVATGDDSTAAIGFGAGRTLVLGQGTQVQITGVKDSSGKLAYVVNLLRGSALAEVSQSCQSCPPILVRAGDETYSISVGNRVGVYKQAGKKARKFAAAPTKEPIRLAKVFVPKAIVKEVEAAPIVEVAPPPLPELPVVVAKAVAVAPAPAPVTSPVTEVVASGAPGLPAPSPETAPGGPVSGAGPTDPVDPPAVTAVPGVKLAALAPVAFTPKGYEVRVRPPASGATYLTVRPLASLSGEVIEVPFTAPAGRPVAGKWRPAVQLLAAGGKGRQGVIVPASAGDTAFRIPVEKLRAAAQKKSRSGATEYQVRLKGGAVLSGDGRNVTSFDGDGLDLRIVSLAERGSGPVTVGFDSVTASSSGGPWLKAKSETNPGALPYVIRLGNGDQLGALTPFLQSSARIGITSGGPETGQGTFLVRGKKVIGSISGSSMNGAALLAVMNTLGVEFVFRGKRSALLNSGQGGGADQTAGGLLSQGKMLYILKKDKIIPINADFMKGSEEVAQFVNSQANALFSEPVEIVAVKY